MGKFIDSNIFVFVKVFRSNATVLLLYNYILSLALLNKQNYFSNINDSQIIFLLNFIKFQFLL